jgi:transcriptional regulator with XRE-family HTH domain
MAAEAWVPTDTFAARLRLVRFELGWSVEEAADRCHTHPATLSKWERGASPRGLAGVVVAIVAASGVDRDWLMWGGPLRTPSTVRYSDSTPAAAAA